RAEVPPEFLAVEAGQLAAGDVEPGSAHARLVIASPGGERLADGQGRQRREVRAALRRRGREKRRNRQGHRDDDHESHGELCGPAHGYRLLETCGRTIRRRASHGKRQSALSAHLRASQGPGGERPSRTNRTWRIRPAPSAKPFTRFRPSRSNLKVSSSTANTSV